MESLIRSSCPHNSIHEETEKSSLKRGRVNPQNRLIPDSNIVFN
jgi:hypothetical protein